MWTEVNNAFNTLEAGGLILYPTDTIWGIGCDALNEQAVKKVYDLKRRSDAKSLIILLAEAKDIFSYVANPHPDIIALIHSFERPTTVIYDQAIGLPDNLINADGSIAIRVTKDPFSKLLIKKLKKPLVSTSANISGNPSPKNYNAITKEIKDGVDYIVNHRRDEKENPPSSRILKVNSDGSFRVIRD